MKHEVSLVGCWDLDGKGGRGHSGEAKVVGMSYAVQCDPRREESGKAGRKRENLRN